MADTPGLAFRIANDPTLTPKARTRLLDTTQRPNRPDPPQAVSNANALKLIDRIRRDDGDAERITDPTPILEAFNRGDLNQADYKFVVNQLEGAGTPEGALLAAKMRAFMFHFKPLVDPARPDADAVTAQQTLQMEQALVARVERMQGDHKDPNDLFDPTKPDYLTTPFDLLRSRTPQETPSQTPGQLSPAEVHPVEKDISSAPTPPQSQSGKPREPASPSSQTPNHHSESALPNSASGARETATEPQSTSPEKDLAAVAIANTPTSIAPGGDINGHDAGQSNSSSPDPPDVEFIKDGLSDELQRNGIYSDVAKTFTDALALLASSTAAHRILSPHQDRNIVAQRPDVAEILSNAPDAIRGARAAARPPKGKPKRPSKKLDLEGPHGPKPKERIDAKHPSDERPEDRPKRRSETHPSEKAAKREEPPLFDQHLTQAEYVRRIDSDEYVRNFFGANPELRKKVWIHHAIPKDIFRKFRGVIPIDELHALGNLRGIPNEINRKIHLGGITNGIWKKFIEEHRLAGTRPTMEEIRNLVRQVDEKHGKSFMPPYTEAE